MDDFTFTERLHNLTHSGTIMGIMARQDKQALTEVLGDFFRAEKDRVEQTVRKELEEVKADKPLFPVNIQEIEAIFQQGE